MKTLMLISKIKFYSDALWGVAAVCGAPCLMLAAGYWASGGGDGLSVASRLQQLTAIRGQTSTVHPDLEVQTSSSKVVYRIRLVDKQGRTVYVYPEVESSSVGNTVIQIPDVPGDYEIYTDITYAKNPIKNETLRVKTAKLSVGD